MKTEQEQIEEMSCILTMLINCGGGCMAQYCHLVDNYAKKLIEAGYGDVSEYKAEIERLKAEYEKLQTNAEILASGVRDLNHENYELTQKLAKQTRIARDANAKCTGAERYLRPFQYKADRLETKCNDLKRLSDWQREEIKWLKAEVNKGCDNCETVKQAQIDVLNKAKKRSYCDNDFMDGKWHRYVLVSDIDELIKEVQNE